MKLMRGMEDEELLTLFERIVPEFTNENYAQRAQIIAYGKAILDAAWIKEQTDGS